MLEVVVEETAKLDRPGTGPYPTVDSCMENRMLALLVPGTDPPQVVGKL